VTDEHPGGTGSPDLVAGAFAALDEAAIRWVLLREDRADGDGGDVDLLVHPADADRLEPLLATVGFARVLTWRHGYHRFFVAYDAERDAWVKLDVVTQLAFRTGRELPSGVVEAVLARSERHGSAIRPVAEDEFWALLLHCLLDRGTVPPHHLERLQHLAQAADPSGPLRAALTDPQSSTAVARTRAGDLDALAALAPDLDAALVRPAIATRLSRGAARSLAPFIKMVRRPGISVAILGPDGAGKTTLIRTLSSRFFFPGRSYYVGLYGGNRRRTGRTSGIPGFALAGQLVAAWRAYLAGAVQRRRGRLVIFDRYGYDALLPSRTGRDSGKRRARGVLLGRLSPRPDLVVVLDASPEQLLARKQEHGAEDLERQRRGYFALAERLRAGGPVEIVDASRDAASVHRQVTAALWRLFAQRRHA
jgi:thymidylate kinase